MKNEKIGLITTHSVINYGAVLQAFALHKSIIDLGYDCEVINYYPKEKISGKKNIYSFNSFRSAVSSLLLFFNIKYKKDLEKKRKSFDAFLEHFFNISKENYSSYDEMKNKLPKYKALVCGSDQIWNLNLMNDSVYFLEFSSVYPKTQYIAYAPSISEKLTDSQYNMLLQKVSHFSALSLREKNDASFLNNFSNRFFENVLDPVFLLDKSYWDNLGISMDIKSPYILCYEISSDSNFSRALEMIRKKIPHKLICINTKPYNKHNANILLTDVSLQNFLWLIKNASFVVTSSFHATAFSVIFKKDFYAVASAHRASRHISLLSQVGLQDRVVLDINNLTSENFTLSIDYSDVDKKLKKLRQYSINYLSNALKGKI